MQNISEESEQVHQIDAGAVGENVEKVSTIEICNLKLLTDLVNFVDTALQNLVAA